MSNFKIAVIGVGKFGQHHARILSEMPNVDLSGVVDLSKEKAEEIAKKFNTRAYSSHNEVVSNVDGVVIAVPTISHHFVAKDFLSKGISAMVEKPLAKTNEEAEDLVKCAEANRALLQVGHVERFNPTFVMAKDKITIPRFIESHRIAPFKFRSTDIDVVLDLMIHDIDIILHLNKSNLKTVNAVGVSLLFGQEDMANARLEFEDGCVANVTANRVSATTLRRFRIFCQDSYVTMDFMEQSARIYKLSPKLKESLASIKKSGNPSPDELQKIPADFYQFEDLKCHDQNEPLRKELEAFIESTKNKSEPVVSGEHGLRSMKVAHAVLQEIREHTWK